MDDYLNAVPLKIVQSPSDPRASQLWMQKARAMSDLGDAEWMQMVCVETSNVSAFAVDLSPGLQHKMTAIISVED